MMLEPHPFADLFPMLDKVRADELRADIGAHGLREKVVLWHDQILDGRNRYQSLIEIAKLGLLYKGKPFTAFDIEQGEFFVWFTGTEAEALEFVLSKNLHRRHLDESQRAMVAANLAGLKPGRPSSDKPANLPVFRQAEAAERLHVSERSVRDARAVVESGVSELQSAVERGDLKVSSAAIIARGLADLPAEDQARIIRENADPKALSKVAKDLRADKQREKAGRREERERALGSKVAALPDRKYCVIIADPEWKYLVWSEETGRDRSPDNHYPTSPLEDIKARPVGDIAADDCLLFLWVTVPFLDAGLAVMEAWGFHYVTHIVWIKDRPGEAHGTGYWFTGEHEIVLVGKRGAPPAPTPGTQFPSYFVAPVGEHSAKPDRVHEIAEAYFPSLPKIELNARRRRPGWDAWGYEADGENDGPSPEIKAATDFDICEEPNRTGSCALLGEWPTEGNAEDPREACEAAEIDPCASSGARETPVENCVDVRRVEQPAATGTEEARGRLGGSSRPVEGEPSDSRLITLIGDVVAFALNVGATLQMGDSRLHSPEERLIRRHVIRIAVDDFKISCPRLAAVLGGSKQAAAQLRLAAIGEIEADADLAAKLSKVKAEVTGRLPK